MNSASPGSDLKSQVINRIKSNSAEVWTPADFVDLGNRSAIDKTLQRLANAGELRRIDRGLYDLPRKNTLTGQITAPDYRAVIRAVSRRNQARTVVHGMTAANDLGFTTAVPARARHAGNPFQVRSAQPPLLGRPASDARRTGPVLDARHVVRG